MESAISKVDIDWTSRALAAFDADIASFYILLCASDGHGTCYACFKVLFTQPFFSWLPGGKSGRFLTSGRAALRACQGV